MIRTGRRRWLNVIALASVTFTLFLFVSTVWNKSERHPVINTLRQSKSFDVVIEGSDKDAGSMQRKTVSYASDTSASNTNEKVCNVPKLNINGADVAQFFKANTPTICRKPRNWAFINSAGRFSLISSKALASCQVQTFTRKNDNELLYGEWTAIRPGDSLPDDFVKVQCKLGGESWDGLLMSVVRNEKLAENSKTKTQPSNWSGLDVFFLGMDSVSHMSYLRKLPKTAAYFEKIMGGVTLDAYNIVGDGTPQAFIPILTGKTEEELPLTRKRFSTANYVDDVYPFIWKNFSDAGYATLYGEDAANIGTFTYRLKGFRNQPTDHYTRTYFQEHEKVSWGTCSGSVPVYKPWFRYSKEFMKAYKDLPRFLMMHLSMFSHDDVNALGPLDDEMEALLKEMHEGGLFDRALVVLMADHGARYAKLRGTHQGQLEERLPFFAFAVPQSVREGRMKTAWENLIRNKDILSTPFDIHATLMDILHLPNEKDLQTTQDASKRSLSLFRPLPLSRTCEQAGVDTHWCTCLNWEDATQKPEEKTLVEGMAHSVVDAINAQTAPERALCSPLRLKSLIYARRMVPNEALLKYKNVKDADGFVPDLSGSTKLAIVYYQLKLGTTPGKAEYEITLRHEVSANKLFIDLNSISHINKYGDDPHCIIDKNYFLATYCVCYDKV
ncbi:unnamed protein product, partial [Mesorhabditis belari]|uniref:DUF229 domain containing protein n=1 Tax=Mesorhabditis belari TaxID=2138241 RepID=A0AAF3JBS5_9BILA